MIDSKNPSSSVALGTNLLSSPDDQTKINPHINLMLAAIRNFINSEPLASAEGVGTNEEASHSAPSESLNYSTSSLEFKPPSNPPPLDHGNLTKTPLTTSWNWQVSKYTVDVGAGSNLNILSGDAGLHDFSASPNAVYIVETPTSNWVLKDQGSGNMRLFDLSTLTEIVLNPELNNVLIGDAGGNISKLVDVTGDTVPSQIGLTTINASLRTPSEEEMADFWEEKLGDDTGEEQVGDGTGQNEVDDDDGWGEGVIWGIAASLGLGTTAVALLWVYKDLILLRAALLLRAANALIPEEARFWTERATDVANVMSCQTHVEYLEEMKSNYQSRMEEHRASATEHADLAQQQNNNLARDRLQLQSISREAKAAKSEHANAESSLLYAKSRYQEAVSNLAETQRVANESGSQSPAELSDVPTFEEKEVVRTNNAWNISAKMEYSARVTSEKIESIKAFYERRITFWENSIESNTTRQATFERLADEVQTQLDLLQAQLQIARTAQHAAYSSAFGPVGLPTP